jgi:hypothetical protein
MARLGASEIAPQVTKDFGSLIQGRRGASGNDFHIVIEPTIVLF